MIRILLYILDISPLLNLCVLNIVLAFLFHYEQYFLKSKLKKNFFNEVHVLTLKTTLCFFVSNVAISAIPKVTRIFFYVFL